MEKTNIDLIEQIRFVMERKGWKNGKLIMFVVDSMTRLEEGKTELDEALIDDATNQLLKLKKEKKLNGGSNGFG